MFKVDILFGQIKTFIKVCVAFFWALLMIDFTKIYQLKGLAAQKQMPHELLSTL